MRGSRQVVAALIVVVGVTACANETAAPREPDATLRVVDGLRLDDLEAPDSSGSCRSGYVVVNGRCMAQ